MIAILEAYRSGLLQRRHWLPNLTAGLVVGVVALPLAMAFAIASGVRPEHGIYTAIIAGLIVSMFGGSRLQIAGPTGAFVVILSSVTARYGIEGLQLATLMAGLILIALGVSRLGSVIKFIPMPVILGFTTGIGVIIFVGQWANFLGLQPAQGEHFHEKLWSLIRGLPEWSLPNAAVGCVSLGILLLAPRLRALSRIPAPLLAMIAGTALAQAMPMGGVATIGSAFGGIPQSLPTLHVPHPSASEILTLIAPAFTIAMLGAIESLLSAVVADGMAETKHDSNQELIGQGIANVLTPLFGGFAATGAIARTATNIRNGATGPLAGIAHAITLLAILLAAAPLAAHIPLAALAAILFVVAYNMSELHRFTRMIRRAPRADVAILLITFSLTVFADLVVAVNVGVILAILQFLRRMAATVEVRSVDSGIVAQGIHGPATPSIPRRVQVFAIQGPLFFAAVENFERALAQTHTDSGALVLRLQLVPFMDITGIEVLETVIARLRKRGVFVVLCEANARVLAKLQRAGILRPEDPDYSEHLEGAVERARVLTRDARLAS
jgi:SulP family sulfate permease